MRVRSADANADGGRVAQLVAAASRALGLPINRSTVVVHADINSVSRRCDPWPPATREARVKRIIARASAILAAADRDRLALALPEKVEMARPTGVGRAITTYEIPIEGRDEWLAAARVRSA